MTIHYDIFEVLTNILLASFAVFLLSGSVFVYGIHRYEHEAIASASRMTSSCANRQLSLNFAFFALVMVFVAFFFMVASSALIMWLKMLCAGVL